jgi:disulfide bond formation protein DsbB
MVAPPASHRRALAPLVLLAGAFAVIAAALATQYVGGLAPCELCLYERWPYYAALPAALVLVLLPQDEPPAFRRTIATLLLLIFLGSSGLAFYHVGVEQHWFQGPTACTGAGGGAETIDQLRALLSHQQTVRCDVPQWSFHGVTLAGLNLVASMGLAALAAAALAL